MPDNRASIIILCGGFKVIILSCVSCRFLTAALSPPRVDGPNSHI